jgi:hypothetical protein
MTSIFLTGDRSIPSEIALVLASGAIANLGLQAAASAEPVEIWTGDSMGFEAGVREVTEALQIPIQVLGTPLLSDGSGKPDWDQRHRLADNVCDRLVIVHGDPLSSSIGASALKILGDKAQLASLL